jgi:hypothetical protein
MNPRALTAELPVTFVQMRSAVCRWMAAPGNRDGRSSRRGRIEAIVLSTVALPLLTSCYVERIERSVTEQVQIEMQATSPSILVRVDRGSIVVEGSGRETVDVEFETVARAGTEQAAEAALLAARTRAVREGDRVTIEATRTGGLSSPTSRLRTNVSVRAPRGARLDLRTHDGSVSIESTEGDIDVESADGRIELRDVRGKMKLRAADGRIRGEDLEGEIDALSEDGPVELSGAFRGLRAVTSDGRVRIEAVRSLPDRSSWMLRSSDGSIRLLVPDDFAAELDASAADGDIDLAVSGFVGDRSDRRVRGTLGGGGPLVLITASDGRVTIRTR